MLETFDPKSDMALTLSVVVPVYNEEAVLDLLASRMRPVLDQMAVRYEVIAVDDGSTDATPTVLSDMRLGWPQLRVIRLRRNSGHQAALTAGLNRSLGEFVVSIDADLQDPPEKIPEMVALASAEQLDIVYGVRTDRTTDTWLKRSMASAYYRLMRRLVGNDIPRHAGDFRLLSRAAVNALIELPERQPVYRLLVPWLGFPSGQVTYRREVRAAGSTKYPMSKMIRLGADSVTNFSAAPLRIATMLGIVAFFACLLAVIATITVFALGMTVPGWASLFVAVLFLGATQLICLGLLGEYLSRAYSALQGRPSYYVASDSNEVADARPRRERLTAMSR